MHDSFQMRWQVRNAASSAHSNDKWLRKLNASTQCTFSPGLSSTEHSKCLGKRKGKKPGHVSMGDNSAHTHLSDPNPCHLKPPWTDACFLCQPRVAANAQQGMLVSCLHPRSEDSCQSTQDTVGSRQAASVPASARALEGSGKVGGDGMAQEEGSPMGLLAQEVGRSQAPGHSDLRLLFRNMSYWAAWGDKGQRSPCCAVSSNCLLPQVGCRSGQLAWLLLRSLGLCYKFCRTGLTII